ncbi:MAG: 30S ribosome-binding factor RbfA [Acidobacteriota bacterium]|nr:30S ribosome-binding factor RbfA [Acidobacteriota bacterium]
MENHRSERVSEALREELSELISYELSDPRIGDAIVTEVLVSPDMRRAQVRLRLSAKPGEQKETIRALEGAKHFLKQQLAERLTLFRIPELYFEADISSAVTGRMDDLLKRVKRGRPRDVEPSST